MNVKPAGLLLLCGAAYCALLLYLGLDVRAAARIRDRRTADFVAFSKLFSELPNVPPTPKPADPLLVRLQRIVEPLDLKDRSPKWSGREAGAGQPATVTLSLEGVPLERIAALLEQVSAERDITVPSFLLERSGASVERFDFSATFVDPSPAAGSSAF
ncbi:MAG: hypothetical protein A3G34_13765 [Candidatus Lindowbacteria bacterium RIFCSPLOWO2_12_FULL_62_27]|nr:MAG: hypothetical protein A3I06_12530 [Candidatus Lindowbacteria bacterium RIFCSPLOWO2_02_FULL_62_12]OGH62644.1 MAG: hypothetical protein A3G34_13765 [Candidatus Lindowbacteria bacterium RIFCSPLOWO2_12_FULL_62_27]